MVLGTLYAGCLIDQDAQGFTGAVQAIGEQAGIGFMQRVVGADTKLTQDAGIR